RARQVQEREQQRRMHGKDGNDGAALVAGIDVGSIGHPRSTPITGLRCAAGTARLLAARARRASAAVAGLSTLACDLALLRRIHRRETTLRTATLGCCHHVSPWLIGNLRTPFRNSGCQC